MTNNVRGNKGDCDVFGEGIEKNNSDRGIREVNKVSNKKRY